MYIKDESTELSLLVDRAIGGSSIVDGQVELMFHRYIFSEDFWSTFNQHLIKSNNVFFLR